VIALGDEVFFKERPLEEARAAEEAKLNSEPEWINRETGTVRIPLDEAIDRTLEYYSQPGRQAAAEWNAPTRTAGGPASAGATEVAGGGN